MFIACDDLRHRDVTHYRCHHKARELVLEVPLRDRIKNYEICRKTKVTNTAVKFLNLSGRGI